MSDLTHPSRRTFVAAATTAAAATAAASPAAAQTQPSGVDVLRNPTDAFPKPLFPLQQQPWPGLQSKMTPRPDSGEQSYKGHGRLVGRKALITGGDSGIGRAVAIAFAREGADVVINHLPQEEPDAREVLDVIHAAGRKGVSVPGDIKTQQFCQHLVDESARQLGGLDIVVHNAARQIYHADSIMGISDEEFDEVYKTNVYAMFRIAKAAVPHLPPGGVILFTTSEQAYDPSAEILHYASTKAAIANFTKGLAKGLITKGIRVNAVAPGPIWTPLQISGGQAPEKIPQFGMQAPMKRAGEPVELAPAFVALAAADNTYATGQIYGVNGGTGVPG